MHLEPFITKNKQTAKTSSFQSWIISDMPGEVSAALSN